MYDLVVAEITVLPLGPDSSAAVYQVDLADGTRRFLKARFGAINEAGLRVPQLLQRHGVPGIVAPFPTRSGTLRTRAGQWNLILYPFVDGASGMDAGLHARQWEEYSAALRHIHAAPVSLEIVGLLKRATLTPRDAPLLP